MHEIRVKWAPNGLKRARRPHEMLAEHAGDALHGAQDGTVEDHRAMVSSWEPLTEPIGEVSHGLTS